MRYKHNKQELRLEVLGKFAKGWNVHVVVLLCWALL